MVSPIPNRTVRAKRRPTEVSDRAVALWSARAYDGKFDALYDLSGNGLHARLGSAVGADTNDPLRLPYGGAKHVYFPGSAGNSLSLPRPVASVDYLITYSDGTTATGTSTADPLVFGATDVQFAGLKVASIALTNTSGGSVVGGMVASAFSEPYASYTDPQGNVWTFNRSASGRKLCVVDRDLLLLGTDDYLKVASSPLLNFGAGDSLTVAVLYRYYATQAANATLISKYPGGVTAGYAVQMGSDIVTSPFIYDGADAASGASAVEAGITSLVGLVANRSVQLVWGFKNGTLGTPASSAAVGSLVNANDLRIGARDGGTPNYGNYEFMGAAIFREPLSAAELIRLKQEMLAR